MSQLNDIINQINSLTGYNVPTSSVILISQSANPVGSGSVNNIISEINTLTGFNIPNTAVQYVSGTNVAGPVIVYTPYAAGGTISTDGIIPGQIIKAEHVLRIINALNGVNVNDIIISGSFTTSGSNILNGNLALPFLNEGDYLYISGGQVVGTPFVTVDSASYATYAETASYAPLYLLVSSTGSMLAPYVLTSSFNSFTASYSTGSFTGSFVGDGSGLTNLPTQSFETGSFATTGSNLFYGLQIIDNNQLYVSVGSNLTSVNGFGLYTSYATGVTRYEIDGIRYENDTTHTSASIAPPTSPSSSSTLTLPTASGVLVVSVNGVYASDGGNIELPISIETGSFATTGSNVFKGNQVISGSLTAYNITSSLQGTASWAKQALTASYLNTLNQDLTVNGNVTLNGTASITYLNVTYESASVIYSSGSNQLGDATNDTQTLIGTVKVSGSLQVTGSANIPNLTGSLFGTATNVAGGADTYIPLWSGSNALTSSYLNQSGGILKSIYGGNDIGLKLDFANNGYYLGNNTTNTNGSILIDATNEETYINNRTIILGDDSANNTTRLQIEDTNQIIKTSNSGSEKGLKLDFANNSYKLGDYNGINNYNYFSINDTSGEIILTGNNNRQGLYISHVLSGKKTTIGDWNDLNSKTKIVVDDDTQTVTITGSIDVSGSSFAWNDRTVASIDNGSTPHIPYFSSNNILSTSSLYQSGSTSVIINLDVNTTANPEALYVYQPHPTSFNVISGIGDLDNYLQLNIKNNGVGTNASSDVVATANNGNETTNYIDMGINGENYTGVLGGPNDGYLYSTGVHLHIGNATPNQYVGFFAGGDDVDTNMKLVLDANNQHQITGSLEISGSLNVKNTLTSSGLLTDGNNTVLGNTIMSGSSTIQGTTTMTGSLNITGSTTQKGTNTLLGNTTLSGSIIISGALGQPNPTVSIYGDLNQTGYIRFLPVTTNLNTSLSASYIFVSGSTNDLYFSQNGSGYNNVTRLRWLEGNLYTGLLHGGLITTQSSTVYQISSGSGIIVNLNASTNNDPYPTIQFLQWPNLSSSIAPLSASYDQSFVGVQSNGTIVAQGTPYTDGQFNTLISIGVVVHQNRSTINAVQTFPTVAYGWKQRSSDFIKAFGPIKIAGYTLSPSGSSVGGLVLSGGTSYVDGRNYTVDPNNPSYITELTGITTSKIFRYRQSGSAAWVYDTNGGAGYTAIDPANYSNNGTLTALSNNTKWSIQRVYYFPNSATKALYVYYGNAQYDTKADAIAAINTEAFNEAPNTSANAIFVGYMLLQKTADFTNTATYEFRTAGLFRGSGTAVGGGSATPTTLAGLSDVSITSPSNNQLLAYNSSTQKWENVSSITANVTGNLTGTATTASYISPTFISASAAASGFGSGGGTVGSFVTSSWTGSTTSQFAGTASFAQTASVVLGSVTTAATASYGNNFVVGNTLTIDATLTDYFLKASTSAGPNPLFLQATGSYTSAFGKYTVYNGANSRAGEFVTSWNGTTTSYYDNSTVDIGSTANLIFESAINGGNIEIKTGTSTPSGWTVKMLVTYI